MAAPLSLSVILLLGVLGCRTHSVAGTGNPHDKTTTTVTLAHLSPTEANDVLSALRLQPALTGTKPHTLEIAGPIAEQEKAAQVLALVDSEQKYSIVSLGSRSRVRSLPSNRQIAQALSDITLGTFAEPPPANSPLPGLLDVLGDQVILIAPVGVEKKVRQAIAMENARQYAPAESPTPPAKQENVHAPERFSSESMLSPDSPVTEVQPPLRVPEEGLDVLGGHALPQQDPNTLRGVLASRTPRETNPPPTRDPQPLRLANGEDVLKLTLPDQMELVDLLELAGETLGLDYVYDAAKIPNQTVSLRLHGKQSGELRVKDLYTLLETALKVKGLAMTRGHGNLVTIVPVGQALDANPNLITPEGESIHVGDTVVTRVFELKHADVSGVMQLIQTLKLSVAISSIPETQTVFVTCYSDHLSRIEKLVYRMDRPGPCKEFRFRQLQHTEAQILAPKLQALATKLQDTVVALPPTAGSSRKTNLAAVPRNQEPLAGRSYTHAVYLDTDSRTNRLLMIGAASELDRIEQLVELLDVAQPNLQTLRVYALQHARAQETAENLMTLGVLEQAKARAYATQGSTAKAINMEYHQDSAQVVVVEATNSLLIHATAKQHQQVQAILKYVDVRHRDLRGLHVYAIENVEAQDVLLKLRALKTSAAYEAIPSRHSTGMMEARHAKTLPSATPALTGVPLQAAPQFVVLETTNALLVHATASQHREIASIIHLVDVQTPKEAVPYEIYFLENQSPDHLADVLNRIVQETVVDNEGKVTRKNPNYSEDPIVIVPDELTFSLIVYASRKNQEWIHVLVEQLDRQQSQVLIDVTLVEISKTDEFNLDLNLITGIPDMVATSGLMEPVSGTVTTQDILDRLHASGRSRFIDLQSNSGRGNAFYGDEQVMLLINTMDEKKYGRVLAKPKVLVNDNETGTITTKDTTYVKETKQSVLPGNSEAVITSEEFTPYEAGITLEIVPHISEDDLLRLNITMTRSDFIASNGEKPPDQSSSDVTTVVTIPDGSTIILGGMLKMNQTKSMSKVPGLGDVPVLGGLFRGSNRTDLQKRLYIFVKAEIIRPAEALANREWDLKRLSDENRISFEAMEKEFQEVQLWPGVKSHVTDPCQVLETR